MGINGSLAEQRCSCMGAGARPPEVLELRRVFSPGFKGMELRWVFAGKYGDRGPPRSSETATRGTPMSMEFKGMKG